MPEQRTETSSKNGRIKRKAHKSGRNEKEIDGIPISLHRKLVRQIGYPAMRKRRIDVKLAAKMHNAGWSYKQIGKRRKVSGCTIYRRLREAGLN